MGGWFTIMNKETSDCESCDLNSNTLPEAPYYPGTKWKWNNINIKRLMMKDVEEDVDKMFQEATILYRQEVKRKQKNLVGKVFKKSLVQFEITPNMSEKKKKLTRFANAIMRAARKIKGLDD